MESLASSLYSDLADGSIRLLRIYANAVSNHIGDLEVVTFAKAPQYYALSYCWGTQSPTVEVGIGSNTISLSPDLAAGIWRLKKLAAVDSETRWGIRVQYIWIDKISINQNDTRERESQVKLMGEIYSRSIRTLIWLGPDTTTCSAAWVLIDRIYDVFRAELPRAKCLADIPLRLYSDLNHANSGLPMWDGKIWADLRALLAIPWFTRIWVVQEVALSSNDPLILHGEQLYSWNRLGWAASWLRRCGYIRLAQIPEAVRNIDSVANIRRSQARWPLEALLTDTSTKFQASDQRDKVYGLLGLAAQSQDASNIPKPLQPDYNLDVEQVYQRVALFLLQQTGSLSMLTRTSGETGSLIRRQCKHNLKHLPSWVPDWSDFGVIQREIMPSLSWISYSDISKPAVLEFPKHYIASAGKPAKIVESPNELILRLVGRRVDDILLTKRLADDRQPSQRPSEGFESSMGCIWDTALLLLQEMGITTWVNHLIEATSAEQHGLSGREWHQTLKDGSAFLLSFLSGDVARKSTFVSQSGDYKAIEKLSDLSIGGDPSGFTSLAGNYCFNRSFFVTSGRRMGIGPVDTQTGDHVVILYGGGLPYIVKKQGSGWLLIGESYVHGLMDGAVAQGSERGEIEEEIFDIQ